MRHPHSALLAGWLLCALAACSSPSPLLPAPVDRQQAIPAGAVKLTPDDDPYPPKLHDAGFTQPIPLPGPINTAGAEDSPFITPQGDTLYFFFTPAIAQSPEEELTGGVAGIYRSRIDSGGWTEPVRVRLVEPGELALDGCPFFQDRELWFCSARQGNYRGVDFWIARQEGDGFAEPRNAGELLNANYQIGEMHLAPGGSDLYFHSNAPGGAGGVDIWVSYRDGDSWSQPVNVATVNTAADEGWPSISADGRELWFTRTYEGSPAVFRSIRSGEAWGAAELVVSQFAGEPTLDAAGNLYFVHHYLIDGELVEADLYLAARK